MRNIATLYIHLKKLDWAIIIAVCLLVGFGLLSIWSSSIRKGSFFNFEKQIIFFVAGFLLMLLISFIDWRGLRDNPYFILFLYFLSVLSLLGLLFFARPIRGVKSWYQFGMFSLDPIEFVKIILIILLAKYFSTRHTEMYRLRHIMLSGMYVFIPSVLVFLQPDFGSVVVFLSIWIGILMISGIRLKHFSILVFSGILIMVLGWFFFLKPYQKSRIIGFVFSQQDPLGLNWSQIQSRVAIGSGGIFGQGIFRGSQTGYGFLPEPQTDFIFAALSEEFGLVGILVLFALFGVLLWRLTLLALRASSNFPRLFSSGFAIFLASHIFVNIGMNLGVLPVIGLPLPLVSYGGSNLIASFIGLGILQSIKTH